MEKNYYEIVQALIRNAPTDSQQRRQLLAANDFAVTMAMINGFQTSMESYDAIEYTSALQRLRDGTLDDDRLQGIMLTCAFNRLDRCGQSGDKISQLAPAHVLKRYEGLLRQGADAILDAIAVSTAPRSELVKV